MDASEDHRVVVAYLEKLRLLGRDVYLYLLAAFLVGLTVYGGIFTVLLNLYLLRLGYGTEFVGLLNATGRFAFAAFCLPAGALGTRWSSRRMMIAGTGLAVAGFGSLPFAEFVSAVLQAGWLLATYTIAWLGLALYFVNSIPFLMNATGAGEHTHAFSVRTALGPLAGFAGSLVGGLLPASLSEALGISLDQPTPYGYTMFIAALLLIAAPLILLSTREPSAKWMEGRAVEAGSLGGLGRTAPYGLIALVSLIGFLRCAGSGATTTFFNVYLDSELNAPAAMIGTLVAIGKLAAGAAALALPLLVRLWGTRRAVILGSAGVVLSLLPLAFIPHWVAAGSGFMSLMALYTIASLSFTVYSQEAVAPGWRAAMSGATNMAAELSGAVMSVGGGYAIVALGYRDFFLIGAGLTTMGTLVFWMSQMVYRGRRI
jgi:MFS family permease